MCIFASFMELAFCKYLLRGNIFSLFIHPVTQLFCYRVCAMFLPEFASFVAAILFAVHPIHTEAVSILFFSCCVAWGVYREWCVALWNHACLRRDFGEDVSFMLATCLAFWITGLWKAVKRLYVKRLICIDDPASYRYDRVLAYTIYIVDPLQIMDFR